MFTTLELRAKGFIPAKNYKMGRAFPQGFKLPKTCTHEEFLNIPLYIQVRYNHASVNNIHSVL